jgi:catechol 2,3-dioxygenase-like lactoylglutathione lyase family enzyme
MARGGINHIALTLSDLAAAEATFYAPVLGFFGYRKVEDIPGKMTLWFNAEAQAAVNLWQADEALKGERHARYAPGFHHCAFSVENRAAVDDLYDVLLAHGICVLDDPAEYPHYAPGYCAVYFEDGDGLKFEAVHMPEFSA